MPSTRSQPLNPRLTAQAAPAAAKPAPPPAPAARRATPAPTQEADDAVRAGGFHESSYELKNGLEVNESEWPPDTTIPGALAPR